MRVYLDDDGPAHVLYVDCGGTDAFAALSETTELSWRYYLPGAAVELHTADGVVSEVLGQVRHALSSVKMSATARREVEAALDELEPGDS